MVHAYLCAIDLPPCLRIPEGIPLAKGDLVPVHVPTHETNIVILVSDVWVNENLYKCLHDSAA